ncbi:MAG: carbon storage regulator [Pirellulaceae bacterium]
MLVLTRRINEEILIGSAIRVIVLKVHRQKVKCSLVGFGRHTRVCPTRAWSLSPRLSRPLCNLSRCGPPPDVPWARDVPLPHLQVRAELWLRQLSVRSVRWNLCLPTVCVQR